MGLDQAVLLVLNEVDILSWVRRARDQKLAAQSWWLRSAG
jgi:hypothetical protein